MPCPFFTRARLQERIGRWPLPAVRGRAVLAADAFDQPVETGNGLAQRIARPVLQQALGVLCHAQPPPCLDHHWKPPSRLMTATSMAPPTVCFCAVMRFL